MKPEVERARRPLSLKNYQYIDMWTGTSMLELEGRLLAPLNALRRRTIAGTRSMGVSPSNPGRNERACTARK